MRQEHVSSSVEQTEQIAIELSRSLAGGECIALEGELGAGKTQFVRGLLRGLGGDARSVSSPTFVLLNVYDSGRLRLFHLDAYRVGDAEDFESIGFRELRERGGVVVVEWASRVAAVLPPNRIAISFEHIDEHARRIVIDR